MNRDSYEVYRIITRSVMDNDRAAWRGQTSMAPGKVRMSRTAARGLDLKITSGPVIICFEGEDRMGPLRIDNF